MHDEIAVCGDDEITRVKNMFYGHQKLDIDFDSLKRGDKILVVVNLEYTLEIELK